MRMEDYILQMQGSNARVQVNYDTDNTFGSASDTLVPSQLVVKTYVDGQLDLQDELSEMSGDSGDITEGSNLYFTTAKVPDARIVFCKCWRLIRCRHHRSYDLVKICHMGWKQ